VPVAGVVDALEQIHAALADDGVVVDTQPVSAEPPVVTEAGPRGRLDMSAWSHTIAEVDREIMRAVDSGLFEVTAERVVVVTDVYDDLAELVAETGNWAGTAVPADLALRAATESGSVRLHQEIRVRLLARR
jgi:hypothetical protein